MNPLKSLFNNIEYKQLKYQIIRFFPAKKFSFLKTTAKIILCIAAIPAVLFFLLILGIFLPDGYCIGDIIFGGPKSTVVTRTLRNNLETENIETAIQYSVRDIEKFNREGENGLLVAVSQNHLEVVKIMIAKGINVNLTSPSAFNESPLLEAVRFGRYEIAKYLIEHGADLEIADRYGNNPITRSMSHEKLAIRLLLIRNGAKCDIRSEKGEPIYTKEKADRLLLDNGMIRDYNEKEIWLLSCLKSGINVKDKLAELYAKRAESLAQLANDRQKSLAEFEKALLFATDEKLKASIKNAMDSLNLPINKAEIPDISKEEEPDI